MGTLQDFIFPPFRFDSERNCLLHGAQEISLRPKTLAVLRYLLEHAGQLVSTQELHAVLWQGTSVSDGVPTVSVHELRAVLGDNAKTSRYIETVYKRGYRFIAPLSTAAPVPSFKFQVPSFPPHLVGRDLELAQLREWLSEALTGARQLVFVTGEPGIGKTALVDAFLHQLPAAAPLWIGQGQCIEHYGAGEPYLPVLEAIGRVAREDEEERVVAILRRYAPTWLAQLPALLRDGELEGLQRAVHGVTPERMLREMADALEALSLVRPVLLWFEDLQWCDYSTLELLALVARRRAQARVLVIGTYRPTDVAISGHPLKRLKQDLHVHRQCEELALAFLGCQDVEQYLAVRFPQHHFPPDLAQALYKRTEGNPLFLVNVIADLARQGVIEETEQHWKLTIDVKDIQPGVPENLRQMIEQQVDRLAKEEQRLLEVAGAAGLKCSAAEIAAGVEEDTEWVEARCEELVRRGQFLRNGEVEPWPDGTASAGYSFQHALYQSVLYSRLTDSRRRRVHQRLGMRLEQAYGEHPRERAAELAMHFERGQDFQRAVRYLQLAADTTMQRAAYQETIDHMRKGIGLLHAFPDSSERASNELRLQTYLGVALTATKGYAAPEAERAYVRVRELCAQVGDDPQLFPPLFGMWLFHLLRAELGTAKDIANQALRFAQRCQDPSLLVTAHIVAGVTCFHRGQLAEAMTHLEQGLALDDDSDCRASIFLYDSDLLGACLNYRAWTLWHRGYPAQALENSQQALARTQRRFHRFTHCFALDIAAGLHQFRREESTVREMAEAEIELARENEFPFWLAQGTIYRGWACVQEGQTDEGIEQIQQGVEMARTLHSNLDLPHYLWLLAEGYGSQGKFDLGLTTLEEALLLVIRTEERYWEAEIHRLKGELLLAQAGKNLS